MSSLSLEKPLLLIMVGYPGAGKSTFADQFSEIFSAPVVSHDSIRYLLFTESTYNQNEQIIISNVASYQISELFKTKKSFIVDGGGNVKTERHKLQTLAKNAGYGCLTIWVQTDLKTSKSRSIKPSRGRSNQQLPPLTSEQFDILAKKFTEPSLGEDWLVISGKHTFPTQARAVLKRLVANREKAVDRVPKIERPTPKVEVTKPRRLSVPIN